MAHLVGALDDKADVLTLHGLSATVGEDTLLDLCRRVVQRWTVCQLQVDEVVDLAQRKTTEVGEVFL